MKRRFILLVSAATMLLGMASAQTTQTQPAQDTTPNNSSGSQAAIDARQRRMADKVSGELGLTEEQKARLRAIREKEEADIRAIRNDMSLTQEQRRAKLNEVRQSGRSQFEGALTAEQRSKIKAAREKNGGEGRRFPGKPRKRGPKPGKVQGTTPSSEIIY